MKLWFVLITQLSLACKLASKDLRSQPMYKKMRLGTPYKEEEDWSSIRFFFHDERTTSQEIHAYICMISSLIPLMDEIMGAWRCTSDSCSFPNPTWARGSYRPDNKTLSTFPSLWWAQGRIFFVRPWYIMMIRPAANFLLAESSCTSYINRRPSFLLWVVACHVSG